MCSASNLMKLDYLTWNIFPPYELRVGWPSCQYSKWRTLQGNVRWRFSASNLMKLDYLTWNIFPPYELCVECTFLSIFKMADFTEERLMEIQVQRYHYRTYIYKTLNWFMALHFEVCFMTQASPTVCFSEHLFWCIWYKWPQAFRLNCGEKLAFMSPKI